jgi:lycopene beta-cyclase
VNEFDAIIAGGGLSGLSLAAALARVGWRDRSVLVVDDASWPAATAWGFWASGVGPLDAAISQSFSRVRFHANGGSRLLSLAPYQYHVVRRSDLLAVVHGVLADCPGFQLRTGHVQNLTDRVDGTDGVVATIDGERVTAGWAFDSVTAPATTPPDARMAFFGWEVRCDQPVFDADTPVLFDFRTPQPGGPRFGYVLPTDRHRALVEMTEFVARGGLAPQRWELAEALARYLTDVVKATGYEILRSEEGLLPLRTRPPERRSGRTMAIGSGAGLVKASTGYAFQRIQADSTAIASSLARHGHPSAVPLPRRRHRFMDAVLLEVLDQDSSQLELAFARMFSALPPALVLRFLDEESRLVEDLRLALSLPPAPYLRAVSRAVRPGIPRPRTSRS